MVRLPRRLHRWYAEKAGYFWLPCPFCREEFGGHEVRSDSLTIRTQHTNNRRVVCPTCTRRWGAGKIEMSGVDRW